MQAQGVEVNAFPIHNGTWIVRQANDIPTLEREMAQAFNAYLIANPVGVLIDIDLSGGGAGNVFMCQALLVPGGEGIASDQEFVNQNIQWFFGSDAHTLQTKENAWLLTLGVGESLWAWSASSAGDGAIWGKVLITWTPAGPG